MKIKKMMGYPPGVPLSLLFPCSSFPLLLMLMVGCRPDPAVDMGTKADAAFTMKPVAGRVNTYLLESSSQNAIGFQWDKGNGSFVKGKAIDTAYFPLKGNFKVTLRAYGRGGYDTASQSVVIAQDDIQNNPLFKLITAKSWKLNGTDGANSIIVGTENNPGEYFGGGPLADCQKDDIYTFSTDFKLNYNAQGASFNGSNIVPNFSCGTDRSYNVAYTFAPGTPGGAGIATITLPGAVPANFIGVTDVSSNNYRIISLTATAMVLRSGTSTETVHQFKFTAQ